MCLSVSNQSGMVKNLHGQPDVLPQYTYEPLHVGMPDNTMDLADSVIDISLLLRTAVCCDFHNLLIFLLAL